MIFLFPSFFLELSKQFLTNKFHKRFFPCWIQSEPEELKLKHSSIGNKLDSFFYITPLFAVGYFSEVKLQVTIQ